MMLHVESTLYYIIYNVYFGVYTFFSFAECMRCTTLKFNIVVKLSFCLTARKWLHIYIESTEYFFLSNVELTMVQRYRKAETLKFHFPRALPPMLPLMRHNAW